MNNQELTTEERQALIGFCKTTMRLKDSEGMGYKLAEFALAALTAEPVKVPDEPNGSDAPSHLDEYEATCWVAGACWMRAEALRLNGILIHEGAIDNTAQQYEALAGWKMVPVEPTAEMYDAGDKQLATKQVWDAMLAAAPKPEGQ